MVYHGLPIKNGYILVYQWVRVVMSSYLVQ